MGRDERRESSTETMPPPDLPRGRAADARAALDRPAVQAAAARELDAVLSDLATSSDGLSDAEARQRLAAWGPNAVRRRRAGPGRVLLAQFKSPILVLLFATAGVSAFVGEGTDAVIIAVILIVSVGLGFVNEYRAARAADALRDRLRHSVVVIRGGEHVQVDVTTIVPGDTVVLTVGTVVPADLRLVDALDLSCDESIVTGEAEPAAKSTVAVSASAGLGDLDCCALMGTVVQTGSGVGVVVATGSRAEFGRIAAGLGESAPQTEFQRGLARFSTFLLVVAGVLMAVILVGNLILQRPLIDSLLFALAIAVGITPQLLPAVVSTSLVAGARSLARRRVLVKRLVCIEDLGDLDLLVTDKTGTLTAGRISFVAAVPAPGIDAEDVVHNGLLAVERDPASPPGSTVGLNALDAALCRAQAAAILPPERYRRVDLVPFDHERRTTAALIAADGADPVLVLKGAPESVLACCADVPAAATATLQDLYGAGARVIAVAIRPRPGSTHIDPADQRDMRLLGFLQFTDPPKSDAAESLQRLASLEIDVKIATGDSAAVAEQVCAGLGMTLTGTVTGEQLDAMDAAAYEAAVRGASIFARVSPEQKARIVKTLRQKGRAVAFLGDGVNDALALHHADIGISVDSAVDVAKDAADVILLDKDLGVLADGVVEGRRIFANTIKYVLMGTSSNFGNMFSASIASVVLAFLPMLPSQILLNNLLYDASQLAIPTDRVDPEQLRAPAHWNIAAIRRFMLIFGPISSLFDFATFGLMLLVFQAAPPEFRSGWFIESIATQTLIIFAIRTTRVPFLRSRASAALTIAALAAVAVGAILPYTPVAGVLGFVPLPTPFFLALVAMIAVYLVLVEIAKVGYYRSIARKPSRGQPQRGFPHRFARRAARFTPSSLHEGALSNAVAVSAARQG